MKTRSRKGSCLGIGPGRITSYLSTTWYLVWIQLAASAIPRSQWIAIAALWCLISSTVCSQDSASAANVPLSIPTNSSIGDPPPSLFDRVEQAADKSLRDLEAKLENTDKEEERSGVEQLLGNGPSDWVGRSGLGRSLGLLLTVSVLSLAPAILLMTTCYVRIVIVLGLLRQALGTGQLPSTQIITSISLFMTLFIMAPVWKQVYDDSVEPFTAEGSSMSLDEAWQAGVQPVREFMSRQIDAVNNEDDVHLFYQHFNPGGTTLSSWEDVPLQVLLPAYLLSELKTAFLMGFMIYLPFLIIDLVVASVTISMGMMMLPPAMISLPFKLLLFVLVDGWHLVVGMLLNSFATIT